MSASEPRVAAVSAANLESLVVLLGEIEAERLPGDPGAKSRAEAELRLSLSRFDFTNSDSSRMLLASAGSGALAQPPGAPNQAAAASAGYALVVRIPKPDARVGFLFVEELYVLAAYRRMGVAAALLRACESLARAWGLHGIRLLVRLENDPARQLYRAAGFAESTTGFCEKLLA